jgi:chromosome segregation ATPase
MEEACTLSYERQVRVKVVSRDGTLFKPNGNFTGGRSTDEDARSGRWDAARLEELKAKRDELREQIQVGGWVV